MFIISLGILGFFYFSLSTKDLGTTELINIVLFPVSLLTLYVARLQYRANHSPVITVKIVKERIITDVETNDFKVIVKNLGNGVCIDSFLVLKEKTTDNKSKYYLSKPVREIHPKTTVEFVINKSKDTKDITRYMLIYMDFLGYLYIAGDAHKGKTDKDNKHLHRLTKPTKPLFLLHPTNIKFHWWKCRAIKQNNTYLGQIEKKIKNNKIIVKEHIETLNRESTEK
ncbi:hypothetical protein [Virgibacillus chiguensis]|uniref:Uncharacterized protein n=1 Tax=Virgibacillus chiguensis TaxID=411959 RepID=A0A1M5SMC3_9BACI|nr:hypothetical protein [Virgibacillus chiguensis]SHH39679.1 hypothetical protein SAMN05421807_106239 [Virgibacillus chiguensis]